jgi:alpha-beta hydrolase superfamily lysophospholipase
MPFWPRLADRLVLCPSSDPIPAPHKTRQTILCAGQQAEIWIDRVGEQAAEPEIFVLKFNGAGGRAERATSHPFDYWTDLPGEVWSPNPPGYGGSEGPATLHSLAPLGRAAFETALEAAAARPIFISGNSLGTAVAIHVAAHFAGTPNLAGLILRNPPPLSQMIATKFGWRSAGLSLLVARQIPRELDSVLNAAQVPIPAVFLSSGRDRTVPPRFQQLVIDAYRGPKQVVTIPTADHVFTFAEDDHARYRAALEWLRSRSLRSDQTRTSAAGAPPAD